VPVSAPDAGRGGASALAVGQVTLAIADPAQELFHEFTGNLAGFMDLVLPSNCHPKIRALYDYWAGRRNERAMPMRADLDPIDIPALLPHVFLIDVKSADPQLLVYRVFGTGLVDLFGFDFTLREVGQGVRPEHMPELRARYGGVIRDRSPFYHRARLRDRTNDFTDVDRIILPLSPDGARVDQMIGMTIPIGGLSRRW